MSYRLLFSSTLIIALCSSFISGCSISYSSGKSSDSIQSILSSSGGGNETKSTESASLYQDDVIAATVSFVNTEGTNFDFQNQISFIAQNHGITDWENEKTTYTAMGEGLRQAGVTQDNIKTLPYFNRLASNVNYSNILQAYQK
ncbi:MAG: putative lipoprotein [Gammaproteobacteria bacterium]|nr:putative lipoprotein [Gammaproteobacteria bacterium]